MSPRPRPRLRLLTQHGVFVVLLLALFGLSAQLLRDLKLQWDWTAGARMSLSKSSLDVLAQLKGPVVVTAYANDEEHGDARRAVRDLVGRYQRHKADLALNFIDPLANPKAARDAGIQVSGEMVVAYQGRTEHSTALNEQQFTNLLMRLARGAEQQVMYLDGHGEPKLDGRANHDLGEFGRQLNGKGFQVAPLNLGLVQDVPANLKVLVVASPRVDLLPGEIDRLMNHLKGGGNLLLLLNPGPLRGLAPLAQALGVDLPEGTVMDPDAAKLGVPQNFSLGVMYGMHPVTREFNLLTVFPDARPVQWREGGEWRPVPVVDVARRGWVETGEPGPAAVFDKGKDFQGPVTVVLALSRTVNDREQRVVVVGGTSFLSNAYLGNGGNLDLGVNLVNWLAGDENLITIQPRRAPDSRLAFDQGTLTWIALGFLAALPLLLLSVGGAIAWQRRRAA